MKRTSIMVVMVLFGLLLSSAAYAGGKEKVEGILNDIDKELFDAMTLYQAEVFSKSAVDDAIEELGVLVESANKSVVELGNDATVNSDLITAYKEELALDEIKLKKLTKVHEKTKVNTVYSPEIFKKNLIDVEKKAIQVEMKDRGLLDEKGDVPKALRDYVTIDELNNTISLLAENLVAQGLSIQAGGLPVLMEHEAFYDLDKKNSLAKTELERKADKTDASAQRAFGRMARRLLGGTSLIFISSTIFKHGADAYHSGRHGVGYIGTGIVVATAVLELLDGYWTFKSRRWDVSKVISEKVQKIKERTKDLAGSFADTYKLLKISSDNKKTKKQVDSVMFSLLFAEMAGGEFYNQALDNALLAVEDINSPVPDVHKEVIRMMLRRSNVYSAEDVLNEYMSVSNDPAIWATSIIQSSLEAKEKAMDWYIALCLLDKARSNPAVMQKVIKLAGKFSSELRSVVLKELSNTSKMSLEEKVKLLTDELGNAKREKEINSSFDAINQVLYSNSISSGKINKIQKLIAEMKEKGVLGEKDASILTDNIGTNAINSSFAKKVLETKERTLAYFVELRGIQKAQNDETTLNAGIERLRETGFLTKEQDKRVLEILDTEFYNGDTNNIFTSTAITYDSNNQVEAGTVTVDNIEEEKTYKGVDGLKDLIKDYAKKGLSCIDVFDKYPELFSKDNLSAFINSASSQPTRAESLNILTQASSIISALESVKPELSALTEDINAVENGLDQTDIALLKSRMETYLGKKVGTSDTEQIITKATDLMLARNGSLDAASDIITKIIFGAKELDFKDGLISLLNNFVENKKGNWLELAKKGALLSLLVIASNDKVNYEKEIFNVADFFVNVVGKNDLYADVLTKTGDYLESPEYLELGLDKVLKEKALNVIDEINKGVEDINK